MNQRERLDAIRDLAAHLRHHMHTLVACSSDDARVRAKARQWLRTSVPFLADALCDALLAEEIEARLERLANEAGSPPV